MHVADHTSASIRTSAAVSQFERPLRARFVICAIISVAAAVVAGGRGDWGEFVEGGRQLLGSDGLHFFVRHPDVQTGPLSLVLARALAVTPRDGFVACTVLCSVSALVAIRLLEGAARGAWLRRSTASLVGGLLVVVSWAKLGGYGHLDDAAVLLLAATALVRAQRQESTSAAIMVGLGMMFKPWAVVFLPLALASSKPGQGWGRRLRPMAIGGAVGSLAWLPFVLAVPRTLRSLHPTVSVASDSVLTLVGISGSTLPDWFRPVQLASAVAVALWAAWRGRYECVILGAVAVRLVSDPGTWSYYTPGLVLGAFAWDLCATRRFVPAATIVASLCLAPTWLVPEPDFRAWLRLAVCGTAVAGVAVASWRSPSPLKPGASEQSPSADLRCPSSDPQAVG